VIVDEPPSPPQPQSNLTYERRRLCRDHPVLLSTAEKCTVTADTVGNAGLPSVVLTRGDDWDTDRWSVVALGNTGNTNAGTEDASPPPLPDWKTKLSNEPSHWIQLDFIEPVLITRVVLDWEAAHSDHYDLQIRESSLHAWRTIVTSKDNHIERCHWGQSPAVPDVALHYEHDIAVPLVGSTMSQLLTVSLRIFVHDSVAKNGYLSLWNVTVIGYDSCHQDRPLVLTELTNPVSVSKSSSSTTSDLAFVTVTASECGDMGLGMDNILSANCSDYHQDRWHVCSSNIYGAVWICLSFASTVLITKVVLDWSAGFAAQYDVQVGSERDGWHVIGTYPNKAAFTTEALGKVPETEGNGGYLHNLHVLQEPLVHQPTRHVRILMHKPATTNATSFGLSLWQVRVYGYKL
jgi:hypothetical protein